MKKIKDGITNFLNDFKEFIMRGNVMDMAIAVIVGGSFQGIVNSLVNNIISPILGIFTQMNFDELKIILGEGEKTVTIGYGSFITAVINFLIMALVIFLMLRGFDKVKTIANVQKEEEEKKVKDCPYCKTEIAIDATRCPNCTSILEGYVVIEEKAKEEIHKEEEK